MTFDLKAVRGQFPILETRVDGNPLHYLDNAASSQMPRPVLDAVVDFETRRRANIHRDNHYLASESSKAYAAARARLARYVNATRAEEIVFTSGTTGSINFLAHAFGNRLDAGDEVVISRLEHHSNILPWQWLRQRRGVVLKVLPATADGRLDLDGLEDTVNARTRLVALTHASNVTGARTDVARVVEAARAVGARVLLDGAQRAPHGPLDMQALGVDFYAFSGHKMFGPHGIGVLWGRHELLDELPPFLGGGHMIRRVTMEESSYAEVPQRFEAGTPPIGQAVGMGAAARWILELDTEAVAGHLTRLTGRVLDGFNTIDGGRGSLRVIGPAGLQDRLPVISFVIGEVPATEVCLLLDRRHGVALRGGHHCAQPLMQAFGVEGTARASFACFNDDTDVDALLNGVEDAIDRLT